MALKIKKCLILECFFFFTCLFPEQLCLHAWNYSILNKPLPCSVKVVNLCVIYRYLHMLCLLSMSCVGFQYEAKKRASAADAMKQPYFNSLGPGVHKLPDGKK